MIVYCPWLLVYIVFLSSFSIHIPGFESQHFSFNSSLPACVRRSLYLPTACFLLERGAWCLCLSTRTHNVIWCEKCIKPHFDRGPLIEPLSNLCQFYVLSMDRDKTVPQLIVFFEERDNIALGPPLLDVMRERWVIMRAWGSDVISGHRMKSHRFLSELVGKAKKKATTAFVNILIQPFSLRVSERACIVHRPL